MGKLSIPGAFNERQKRSIEDGFYKPPFNHTYFEFGVNLANHSKIIKRLSKNSAVLEPRAYVIDAFDDTQAMLKLGTLEEPDSIMFTRVNITGPAIITVVGTANFNYLKIFTNEIDIVMSLGGETRNINVSTGLGWGILTWVDMAQIENYESRSWH